MVVAGGVSLTCVLSTFRSDGLRRVPSPLLNSARAFNGLSFTERLIMKQWEVSTQKKTFCKHGQRLKKGSLVPRCKECDDK